MPPPAIWLHARDNAPTVAGPLAVHDFVKRSIYERDTSKTLSNGFVPGAGTRSADSFNNAGFMALFAILGAGMVVASLWFFFWAKNGGFHFQQGDWDDYKSTVLRRKGPDGRTLSNATKSTKLGGSTIAGTQHYKWARQAAKSVVSRDEKGRKGVIGKRGWAKTHSITYSDDYTDTLGTQTVSDMTEVRSVQDIPYHSKRYRDRDMAEYKKERPARVGGLNRIPDGNITNSDLYSDTSDQPILKHQHHQQHNAPAKQQEKERAERRAREEAAKMERRWKKEAEEAAAAHARESAAAIPQPRKAASPTKPSAAKQRSASRSASPKKRDFSYNANRDSEVLSTAYTGTNSRRTASYYDAYRPQAADTYASYSPNAAQRSREGSPTKKKATGRAGGYRRGDDSDFS